MKKMLTGVVSALALTLLAACGANAAASAAGHYEVDKALLKEKMMAAMPAANAKDPAAAEMVGKMVEGMVITLDLKADGTATMTSKMEVMGQKMDNTENGTWKLEGGKLSMTGKGKDGKEETKTVDYKDGTFTVEHEQGGQKMQMTFHKK
ncbi:MAG: hypothetical protein H6835_16325 [Planctomycetes bacterium]|nr:hypothetical protein [Planctomycetota bacterium]